MADNHDEKKKQTDKFAANDEAKLDSWPIPRSWPITNRELELVKLSSVSIFPTNGYIETEDGKLELFTPAKRLQFMSSPYVKAITTYYLPTWFDVSLHKTRDEEYLKGLSGITRNVTGINVHLHPYNSQHSKFVVYSCGLYKIRLFSESEPYSNHTLRMCVSNHWTDVSRSCTLVVLHFYPTYNQLVDCIEEVTKEVSGEIYEKGITELIADYAFFKHKVRYITKEEDVDRWWGTYTDDENYDKINDPLKLGSDYFK